MISIFGSGFGLYGHLPALVESGRSVLVPSRCRARFEGRAELAAYRDAVQFVDDEAMLLSESTLAILARRPGDNAALARLAAKTDRSPQLVIEKPIAATPSDALALDSVLRTAGVRYATPYLFRYCTWADLSRKEIVSGQIDEVALDWKFGSKPAENSWKNLPREGGGTLSYYFIHVIALGQYLLGDYEVTEYESSEEDDGHKIRMVAINQSTRITATFCAGGCDSAFSIRLNGKTVATGATPFGAIPQRGVRDPRIDVLKRFYAREVFGPHPPTVENRTDPILKKWEDLTGYARHNNAALPV